jgi:prepilin-type N-terminal cleavage/methylation domain-containing protein
MRARQAGFSLIELLVAMTVTLIITGAMYGLLAGGQNAFRREPEMTDRQQAIRLAMDRLQRDVLVAGQHLGPSAQAFTDGLDDVGTSATNGPMRGPNGPTDVLEIYADTGNCPTVPAVRKGDNMEALFDYPDCYRDEQPVMLRYENGAKPVWGHNVHTGNGSVNFPFGLQPPEISAIEKSWDISCASPRPQPGNKSCPSSLVGDPIAVGHMEVIRYLIAPDSDGVPSLWRTALGGFNNDSGALERDPIAAGPGAGWRLVARGVEDLQVQYRTAAGWDDEPGEVGVDPVSGLADYATIVQEVRVTLTARTTATNIAGARSSVQGGDAVRGQLQATISPRPALFYLSVNPNPGPAPLVEYE